MIAKLFFHVTPEKQAASLLGLHKDCKRSACRRARRCVSRRAEDDWTVFPGPGLPPCCNSFERTATVRHWVNVKIEQHNEGVRDEEKTDQAMPGATKKSA